MNKPWSISFNIYSIWINHRWQSHVATSHFQRWELDWGNDPKRAEHVGPVKWSSSHHKSWKIQEHVIMQLPSGKRTVCELEHGPVEIVDFYPWLKIWWFSIVEGLPFRVNQPPMVGSSSHFWGDLRGVSRFPTQRRRKLQLRQWQLHLCGRWGICRSDCGTRPPKNCDEDLGTWQFIVSECGWSRWRLVEWMVSFDSKGGG